MRRDVHRSRGILATRFSAGALGWLAALSLGLGLAAAAQEAGDGPKENVPGPVVHIRVDSIIHPVVSEFVRESLEEAERKGASLFLFELSTPGGLLTSTREIFSAMLESEVPVAVYVSPSGSQAASAGFFLLMAADIAAMAPGTNTGAAHPVGGQGEDIEGDMGDKVEQDAAATIRSLARRNGRNAELAESAVVESRSFTAEEALESELIDLVVSDVPELLAELEGFEIQSEGEEPQTVRTAGAVIERPEMSSFQRFLAAIAHPNIAYILMTLGGLGLYFELQNPGAILPGVIGGICLILAFFALSVLPVNYAGIALIFLALIFFIAEVKVVSYGLLTVGGLISLVIGSLMLFRSADPALKVGIDVIAGAVVFCVVVVGFLLTMAIRAHRSQVRTGLEGLVHERGVARSDLAPKGKVFVHGELWNAIGEVPLVAGDEIEVVSVEGMTLRVRSPQPRKDESKEVQL